MNAIQQDLPLPQLGGARRGAGRKRKSPRNAVRGPVPRAHPEVAARGVPGDPLRAGELGNPRGARRGATALWRRSVLLVRVAGAWTASRRAGGMVDASGGCATNGESRQGILRMSS